jgi:thiamine kinase-like enzyme
LRKTEYGASQFLLRLAVRAAPFALLAMLILSTKNSVVHYLIGRGLLPRKEVVEGSVTILERTSRNRNFLIMRSGKSGYFVKHIQPDQTASIETLEREAAFYELMQRDPKFSVVRPLAPRMIAYDRLRYVLVLELLPNAENLSAYQNRENRFPPDIAERLGTALGSYQRNIELSAGSASGQAAGFPRAVPWILQFHQIQAQGIQTLSAANAQLHAILNRYPDFGNKLDAVRAAWQADTFIHGDIKFENCALFFPEGPGSPYDLKLVDWETADFGDAAWDVGSVFQAYLNSWLYSIPPTPGASAEQLEQLARTPLSSIQPAIRAFWRAYADTMQLEAAQSSQRLERCVLMAAGRMLQTVFEWMNRQQQLSANAMFQLQVSLNMLQRPGEAIPALLGI